MFSCFYSPFVVDLVPSVLESVTNLCLAPKSEALQEVITEACTLLGTVDVQQMPVVARFLLDLADTENARDILVELFTKLQEFLATTSLSGWYSHTLGLPLKS